NSRGTISRELFTCWAPSYHHPHPDPARGAPALGLQLRLGLRAVWRDWGHLDHRAYSRAAGPPLAAPDAVFAQVCAESLDKTGEENGGAPCRRRCQALLDNAAPLIGPSHGCQHFIVPQGSYERDRLPCSLRNMADQSLATRAAASETDH